jgi:hypothetical protein
MELKRYFTKYIRDAVKSRYKKESECRICGTEENLQFHHFTTLSILVNKWQAENGLDIETAEEAFEHRDGFIEEHQVELFDKTVTLCKAHHERLHKIYGKNPALITAPKQERWVEKQRAKNGLV